MSVQIEVGWDYEACLSIFKKAVNKDGILRELKDRQFFLSRSQKRKVKDIVAGKRRKRRDQGR